MAIASAKFATRTRAPCLTLYLVRHAESLNNKISYDYREKEWGPYLRYSDPDLSELGTRQALLLGQHVKEGADPIAEHLRGWKAMGDRFGLYSSPMRRALKTTWGLAQGMDSPPVTVLPSAFEHGGCFHVYPTLAELAGLSVLEAAEDPDTAAEALAKETHYPGLTQEQVTNPEYISQYLNLPEPTPIFTAADPGMETGWWAEQGEGKVESRKECYLRGAALGRKFVEMAAKDEKEVAVLVSHGDLMDCILKSLMFPEVPPPVQDAASRFVHTNTGITRLEIGADGTVYLMKQNHTPHLDAESELLTGGELVHDWDCWDKHHDQEASQGH